MNNEKITSLINLLYANTKSGKITWEESEIDNVYQVAFPEYSLRICKPNNYVIQIINGNGAIIEEFSDEEFDTDDTVYEAYRKMKEIHNMARRQVLRIDQALDSILSNLRKRESYDELRK